MLIEGFNPHLGQQKVIDEFVKTETKFGIVVSSRQWGKSLLAVNSLLYWILNNPKSKSGWISPIYKQCRKVFDELVEATKDIVVSANKAELTIEYINGSSIQFLSAERPDSIRGFSFHYLVVDESAFLKQDAFDQAILPTLSALGKKCLLISTPKGKNWFYNWYLKGLDNRDDVISFKGYATDNPFVDQQFIIEAKQSMPPSVFKQEFEAEFTDDGNDVFKNLEHVSIISRWREPQTTNRYYIGIDPALSGDYSVLSIMDDMGRVCFISRQTNTTFQSLAGEYNRIIGRYAPRSIAIETNGLGIGLYELIDSRNKVNWKTTNDNKAKGIQNLIYDIENSEIELPSRDFMPECWDEFSAFSYSQSPTGKLVFSAPNGYHDDIVMSIMLANEQRRQGGVGRNKIYIGKYNKL